jgi:hypothetical protein
VLRAEGRRPRPEAESLGSAIAEDLLARGADAILSALKTD